MDLTLDREPMVPLSQVLDLMAEKHRERDRAYQDGHTDGYLEGFEDGLRALLAEAAAALGTAA